MREGHEDIGYSYVVIQRGPRPSSVAEPAGRIGPVGKRVAEREVAARMAVLRELSQVDEHQNDPQSPSLSTLPPRLRSTEVKSADQESPNAIPDTQYTPADANEDMGLQTQVRAYGTGAATATGPHVDTNTSANLLPSHARQSRSLTSKSNLEESLRREAYRWPRLVFPPLKRSGHVIIDACTSEGLLFQLLHVPVFPVVTVVSALHGLSLTRDFVYRKNHAPHDPKIAG